MHFCFSWGLPLERLLLTFDWATDEGGCVGLWETQNFLCLASRNGHYDFHHHHPTQRSEGHTLDLLKLYTKLSSNQNSDDIISHLGSSTLFSISGIIYYTILPSGVDRCLIVYFLYELESEGTLFVSLFNMECLVGTVKTAFVSPRLFPRRMNH